MRTSEERVAELHKRMNTRKRNKDLNRYRLQSAALCVVCLALTVVIALVVAGLPYHDPGTVVGGAAASIFADRSALGYVTVALLAFCLGALVTIFCFRIRKHLRGGENGHERDL